MDVEFGGTVMTRGNIMDYGIVMFEREVDTIILGVIGSRLALAMLRPDRCIHIESFQKRVSTEGIESVLALPYLKETDPHH